jgi:hypothetical protein
VGLQSPESEQLSTSPVSASCGLLIAGSIARVVGSVVDTVVPSSTNLTTTNATNSDLTTPVRNWCTSAVRLISRLSDLSVLC